MVAWLNAGAGAKLVEVELVAEEGASSGCHSETGFGSVVAVCYQLVKPRQCHPYPLCY